MPSPQVTALGIQPPVDTAIIVGNQELEQPAEGWDTLKEKLWLPHPYWLKKGQVREYQGPGAEQGTFIVQDLRTVDWWAGRPVVEVISKGIAYADGKDYKIECSGGLNEDLSLASGAYLAATIWRLGYPRVTKYWVSLETPAILDHVGVASVPPVTFGLPATPWAIAWVSASSWTAAGWIGESRTPQRLPGSTACLVTDSWLYDLGYPDRDGVVPGIISL